MTQEFRIATWNVNGIRAASQNLHFKELLNSYDLDVLAVQEIKAQEHQLDIWLKNPEGGRGGQGFKSVMFSAEKPGYSGVAFYFRKDLEILDIREGLGDQSFDREGRVLSLEFPNFVLINAYFPNSQRDHKRLSYKLEFCAAILEHLENLRAKGKNIILCGDFNIAHEEIDLKNPKANYANAGFLPEERAWMSKFLGMGYVDTFRHLQPEGGHYTWWSYRPGVRARNIGWRLDYQVISKGLLSQVADVRHLPHLLGSDHCPVLLDLKVEAHPSNISTSIK